MCCRGIMNAKWMAINSGGDTVGERIAPLNAARTAQRAVPTHEQSKETDFSRGIKSRFQKKC
jgi:hypothetical protein